MFMSVRKRLWHVKVLCVLVFSDPLTLTLCDINEGVQRGLGREWKDRKGIASYLEARMRRKALVLAQCSVRNHFMVEKHPSGGAGWLCYYIVSWIYGAGPI